MAGCVRPPDISRVITTSRPIPLDASRASADDLGRQ